jgi:hypothetical protein
MIRGGTKYVYFFPAKGAGSLFKHFHIYKRGTELSRERGLDITMVGFLSATDYIRGWDEVRDRTRDDHVTVIPTPLGGKVKSGLAVLYFVFLAIFYERVVVNGRKVSAPTRLELAQRIVGDRLKYTIELEGDTVLEAEYATEHESTSFFFNDTTPDQIREKQKRTVERPDHVFTVTEELRQNLIERHHDLCLDRKTTAIMSDLPNEIGYDPDIRSKVRDQLGVDDRFVYAYIGSAAPLWQNVPRTIEIFSLFFEESSRQPFLLLLVPESDHDIVGDLLEKYGISEGAYHLTEVEPDSVRSYLFASDLGVILREEHPMCEVVFGAKYLDYLSAGLPVLTTPVVKWSHELRANDFGIVINDMSDDTAVLRALNQFEVDDETRTAIAEWAIKRFATHRQVDEFVAVLRSLAA